MPGPCLMRLPPIFIVDDDPDHLELSTLAFSDVCPPEDIATSSDGRHALALLHAPDATLPRVVILDIKLGAQAGLDVLRAIRANPRTQALPVLMHSSSVDERDVAASYAAGANGYFRKASSFHDQRETARRIHATWVSASAAPAAPGTPEPRP